MCGIAGLISNIPPGPPDEAMVRRMCGLMAHRGPNDESVHCTGSAVLGMRRLSVIDLATGRQPMFSPDGRVAVVMNGEIYNYRELRAHYAAKGYPFRSQSDTEVLVPLYLEHGDDFVRHLNGMFAIALYDAGADRLLLARDRMGVKPLFLRREGGRVLFSSELAALLPVLATVPETDAEALDVYFSLGYFPAPLTPYAGVERVPPGTLVRIEKGEVSSERFWSMAFRPEAISFDDAVERLVHALRASVERQMVSDVPVGLFMGGGLDSAAVAWLAAHAAGGRLNGFTVGFDEAAFDETPAARRIAEVCGIGLTECRLDNALLAEMLPRRIAALSEPFVSWTNCSIQLLAETAHGRATVVLTGAGGDELFGGYPTLTAHKALATGLLPRWGLEAARRLFPRLPLFKGRTDLDFVLRATTAAMHHPPELRYVLFKQLLTPQAKASVYRPGFAAQLAGNATARVVETMLDEIAGHRDVIDRLLFLDSRMFLGGCVLHSFDHATMAASIEARVPILDNEMIDLALTIPHAYKHRLTTTKRILRAALSRVLPPEIVNLPKLGFSLPVADWMRTGPTRDLMDEIFLGEAARRDPLLDPDAVAALYRAHLAGFDNHRVLEMLAGYYLWRRTPTKEKHR
ncbi:asparagine synthase (glutamine-hydrolyzing) [Oleispirillum naphthae]|uniref:asparagine synthase (glutamine-hydrolyzing) n=1 Tax=Oleispirillum naphthae TaxID=2838853 RepID=UPI00308230D9